LAAQEPPVANLLETAAATLATIRAAHAATAITYTRGATSLSLTASAGQPPAAVVESSGLVTEVVIRDYLIEAADITALSDPLTGDRITEGTRTFEVLPLGGEGCWRWHDPGQTTYRVHTKEVAA
jgi:hypothetical protein